jgi:hypothetical protein
MIPVRNKNDNEMGMQKKFPGVIYDDPLRMPVFSFNSRVIREE